MKTFKLISLQVVEEGGLTDINLVDGLVINKEAEDRSWMVEAYVSTSYQSYFRSILEKNEPVSLQIIISRRENDPANFLSQSFNITPISEDHMSLLFKGTISRSNNYAEQLLTYLIGEGLSGEKLVSEFKEKLITRPILTSRKKS